MRNLVNQLIKKVFLVIAFVVAASTIVCASKSSAVTLTDIEFNAMREYVLNDVNNNAESKVFSSVNLSGAGTEANPYLINDADGLNEIRNNLTAYYKLEADINMSGYEFTPIGSNTDIFTGTLNGGGHTISNIYIVGASSTTDYVGLFASNSGTVKNLSIDNVYVSGRNYVGAIAGYTNNGIFENVYVNRCYVYGNDYVGAVLGWSQGTFLITTSYANGEVYGHQSVGGLIGYIKAGTISKCYSTVSVDATDTRAGGLVGYHVSGALSDCFATGTVIGKNGVGGLIGTRDGSGSVTNSYAIGKVVKTGTGTGVGGLVGSGSGTVTNSYWTPETAGVLSSSIGNQNNIQNMLYMAGYLSWNFSDTWDIYEGESLAFLKGLPQPTTVLAENIVKKVEFDGGYGTKKYPYLISTDKQLNAIRNNPNMHYKLVSDIDLEEYYNWEPIGNDKYKFTGSFNGAGFTIRNLKINREKENYIGLFGISSGSIMNVNLENVDVKGNNYVGGLIGSNTGDISNAIVLSGSCTGVTQYTGGLIGNSTGTISLCISKIDVTGKNRVGGLIGNNSGIIEKSYASGDVVGANHIGGLVGLSSGGKILQCYATGNVVASVDNAGGLAGYGKTRTEDCFATGNVTGRNYVGGLTGDVTDSNGDTAAIINSYAIGKVVKTGTGSAVGGLTASGGSTTNSYWLAETTTQLTSASGEKRTIQDMLQQTLYVGWDFENVWKIEEGSIAYLQELDKPESVELKNFNNLTYFDSGDGTENNPYIITTEEQLKAVQYSLDSNYKLGGNIVLEDENWLPLGNDKYKFTGIFDGAGFTISNLTINRENENYVGLFGVVTGNIMNLNLANVDIKGKNYVGALVGNTSGEISNVAVLSGTVEGTAGYVGGLIGQTTGTVSLCGSEVDVTGENGTAIGGLIGKNTGTVEKCYATGDVVGKGNAGGLIGTSSKKILKSYATGNVEASQDNVGGLVGAGVVRIENCYATGDVTGRNGVGGLIGDANDASGNVSVIVNSYAIGRVTITGTGSAVGGLTGNSCTATNSYWSRSSSGQSEGKKGTAFEDVTGDPYENWDFLQVWQRTSGYPILGKAELEGNGTKNDPYIIKSAYDLNLIRELGENYYKLGADIDLTGIEWEPIGGSASADRFKGTLDGAGYTIDGLTINKESTVNYVGLFAYSEGEIKNIKLTNVNIIGGDYVGGIVGYTTANIEGCCVTGNISGKNRVGAIVGQTTKEISKSYSTGSVTASADYAGGLAGISKNLTDCYSTSNVTGKRYAGGLTGQASSGTITNCYAIGNVALSSTATTVGCLVGTNSSSTSVNSYYIPELSNQTNGVIGTVRTVKQLLKQDGYDGWDFTNTWEINEDEGFAYLRNLPIPNTILEENLNYTVDLQGSGTKTDPYIINTAEELNNVRNLLTAYYKLGNDIDLSGYESWEPIGDKNNKFVGGLDGDGHTISNMTITKANTSSAANNYLGLFGYTEGEISNVKMQSATILGYSYIGAVAGYSTNTISNVDLDDINLTGTTYIGGLTGYSTQSISDINATSVVINATGKYVGGITAYCTADITNLNITNSTIKSTNLYVGGIAGQLDKGNITSCVANVSVEGTESVGGLVGYKTNGGTISKSYTQGTVTGSSNNVGGLIGCTTAGGTIIEQCYSMADVNSTGKCVGGLIGSMAGTVEQCYTTGTVSSTGNQVGGLVGYKSGTVNNCFSLADVTGASEVGGLVGSNSGTLSNSYAIGLVNGTAGTKMGGLVGTGGSATNSYYCKETTNQTDSAAGESRTVPELMNKYYYTSWDFDDVWAIENGKTMAYLENVVKPEGLSISKYDTVVPNKAEVEYVANSATSHSLDFNITAQDEDTGIDKIEIYIDYELVKTIKYNISKTGEITEPVTIDKLLPNKDNMCYVVVYDMGGLHTTSSTIQARTLSIGVPVITASTTELTKDDVKITISANLTATQTIQYKTSGTNWVKYTQPFDVNKNKTVYARVYDGVKYSEEVSIIVDNIDKKEPSITAKNMLNKIKFSFEDVGVAGLEGFKYVIYDRKLTSTETPEYGEEIKLNGISEYDVALNVGKNNIYVQAYDKIGNTVEKVFGEYFLPEGTFLLEIEKVSNMSDTIKIQGAELNIDGKTETTNENGIATFELEQKLKGEYTYYLEESVAPTGYKPIADSSLKFSFDQFGKVERVITKNPNITVVNLNGVANDNTGRQVVKLQVVDVKKDASYYNLIVKAVDENNNSKTIEGVGLKVDYSAESGETKEDKRETDSKGSLNFGQIQGNGELNIKISEYKPGFGYFSNSNDLNVCLSRDIETGVVTVVKEKNTSDLKISISDDKIVILKESTAKEVVNELSLKVTKTSFGVTSVISDIEYTLVQPYGFDTIVKSTDNEGRIVFDEITPLGEGDYIYRLIPEEENGFFLEEIRFAVSYDGNKNIVAVKEITNETKEIKSEAIEKTNEVANDFILVVEKNLDSLEYYDTMNFIVRAVDDDDNTKVLSGVSYKITSIVNGKNVSTNHRTDMFGECIEQVIKQDTMLVRVNEMDTLNGYVLNSSEKKVQIIKDKFADKYIVDTENTDSDIDVTYDEATNTVLVIVKCKTKVSQVVKGNINLTIVKRGPNKPMVGRTWLKGTEFNITETTTGEAYNNKKTGNWGVLKITDFEVKEIGRYEFVIEEITAVPGYDLFEEPVKLEVIYSLDEFENVMKVSDVNVIQGEKYVIAKTYTTAETSSKYILNVNLELQDFETEVEEEDTKTNFSIVKEDENSQVPLKDTKFGVTFLYSDGTSSAIEAYTNSEGLLLNSYLLPQGRTTIQVQELESAPGYELDSTVYEIVINRMGETLIIVSSDLEIEEPTIENVVLKLKNGTLSENEQYTGSEQGNTDLDDLGLDDIEDDDFLNDEDEPGEEIGEEEIGSNEDPEARPFTIEIINANKYNPNLKMQDSEFNVSIIQNSEYVYNQNKKISARNNNKAVFDKIKLDGNMQILVEQTKAPLHHLKNNLVYMINLNKDDYENVFNIEDTLDDDSIIISKDVINHKITITILNDPSEFIFAVTTIDSENIDTKVEGIGFRLRVMSAGDATEIKTDSYLQTNSAGYASEAIYIHEVDETNTYILENVQQALGYETLKKLGVDITTDLEGNIASAEVSDDWSYAKDYCSITNIQNKYVEVKIKVEKQDVPDCTFQINAINSEDEENAVQGVEYRVRILDENGARLNKIINTNYYGKALLEKIKGTGELTFEIEQISEVAGFKFNSGIIKVVVDKQIVETEDGKNSVITLNTEKSDNVNVEIDNETNKIILNLTCEPQYGITVKAADFENVRMLLSNVEFTITSSEGDNFKGITDINGNVFFPINNVVTDNTVIYTITETKTIGGYHITEPIEITVDFDSTGKVRSCQITKNGRMAEILGRPRSSMRVKVYNKRMYIEDIYDPENPNVPLSEQLKQGDVRFVLTKLNAKNNGVRIENTAFDILVTAESGETMHYIGISDRRGQIDIDYIRGSGLIRIDVTELESAYGYSIDDKTRTITVRKYLDENNTPRLTIVEDETTDAFRTGTIDLNVYAEMDNKLADDMICITIEKHDRDENGLMVKNAVFSIKDVSLNSVVECRTDKLGVTTVILPAKNEAGMYVYQIIEQDTLTGYKPAEGVAELRVTYNSNGEIVSAELYGVDEEQYTIAYSDDRYIKIDAFDERREMNLDTYNLVIAKVDIYNNNEPIPNSLLEVEVDHQYGLEVSKEETTNNLGEVYVNNLNGHGKIDISIKELMGTNFYSRRIREARLTRNEITGIIELVSSYNVDIEIDNENRVVRVILKNDEDNIPSGFIVEKVDNEDSAIRIPGIGFEVMNLTSYKGSEHITDEEGRFNVSYKDTGAGAEFRIREIRTDSIGYNPIPDINVRAYYDGEKTTLEILEGAEYASIVEGDEMTYPKLIITNEQKPLDVGSYRLEVIKCDMYEHDIVLPNAEFKIKVNNELGVSELIKEAVTNENGRIYFNKINGAGAININIQEFISPEDYLTDVIAKNIVLNRDSVTGEITYGSAEGIDESNVVINNSNKTISIYIPNELKDGRYNMVIQKVDNEGNLITGTTTEFNVAEVGLIDENTTEEVANSMDNAIKYESNLNGKAISPVLRVPLQAGILRYNIKEVKAPSGYALDENIYHVDIEFSKVDGLMKIVNITSSDENVVGVVDFNNKLVRLNFKDGERDEESLYLTSTVYKIDDLYCDRVSPDTTIKEFCSKIQTNGIKRVFDKNGNELDIEDASKLVGTSFKVRAERETEFIEKEVIVVGDYNEDGTITISDVAAVNKYFLGAIPQSEKRNRICDVTGDNLITISDVGKLNKFFLGAIPILINY